VAGGWLVYRIGSSRRRPAGRSLAGRWALTADVFLFVVVPVGVRLRRAAGVRLVSLLPRRARTDRRMSTTRLGAAPEPVKQFETSDQLFF